MVVQDARRVRFIGSVTHTISLLDDDKQLEITKIFVETGVDGE